MKNYKHQWRYTEKERNPGEYSCCYDCGMKYGEFPDMVIPNDLWELINPSKYKGSGILCPTCTVSRLDHIDRWYDFMNFYLKQYKLNTYQSS